MWSFLGLMQLGGWSIKNFFFKVATEKSSNHIELIKGPAMVGRKKNNQTDGLPSNCRNESFLEVDAMNLFVASSNNVGFPQGWGQVWAWRSIWPRLDKRLEEAGQGPMFDIRE
jgi:hypothetical protein